jgi:MFS family permease
MTAQIAARPDAESGSALISPRRRNFVFLAIMLGMLMAALDQTIVATALPTIVADLGDAGHQSWVVTSYLLASTIITALAGRLGDLFGRKRVFQAAVTFFVIGSALCGIAQSMVMLVGARALQGLGGGAITVTATALIGEIIPLRDRGRYQGAVGAVFGVTTVIGPLLGGYFTDHLSWRWAFYADVPLSIVVLFVAAAAIPSLAGRTKPVIDYAGILFVGLGATGLTLATSWGGTTYPWKSATIIGLFVGSTVALAVFVWVESRVAAPILPTRLFASPVFTVCCVLSFVVGFAMLGALTFLPTYMQFVDGVSATTSGLRTLPMVAGMLLASMGSGVLVGRTPARPTSRAAPTALRSRQRSTGSLTGSSPNRTGTRSAHDRSPPPAKLPGSPFRDKPGGESEQGQARIQQAIDDRRRQVSSAGAQRAGVECAEVERPEQVGGRTHIDAFGTGWQRADDLGDQVVNAEGPEQVGVGEVPQFAKRVRRREVRGRGERFRVECEDQLADLRCIRPGGSGRDRTYQLLNERGELGIKAERRQQVAVGVVAEQAERVSG